MCQQKALLTFIPQIHSFTWTNLLTHQLRMVGQATVFARVVIWGEVIWRWGRSIRVVPLSVPIPPPVFFLHLVILITVIFLYLFLLTWTLVILLIVVFIFFLGAFLFASWPVPRPPYSPLASPLFRKVRFPDYFQDLNLCTKTSKIG